MIIPVSHVSSRNCVKTTVHKVNSFLARYIEMFPCYFYFNKLQVVKNRSSDLRERQRVVIFHTADEGI
jgi:hypothetical protein